MSLLDLVLLATKAAHLGQEADVDGHATDEGHDWPGTAARSEQRASEAFREAAAALTREADIYERCAARHRKVMLEEQRAIARGSLT